MTIYDYLKAVFILLFAFSIYLKLISRPVFNIKNITIGVLYITIITLLSMGVYNITTELYALVAFIIISGLTFAIIYKTDIIESISFSVISFAISYTLHIIAIFVTSIFYALISDISIFNISFTIIVIIFQAILVFFFSRIKYKIILRKNVCLIGNILAGLALIIYSISREEGLSEKTFGLIIVGGALCAIGLFYWIKRESISAYNKKIQDMENEKLKAEVEKEKENRQYYEKIVHNDGKKLPAYQEAVESLIESVDDPVTKEKAERILGELDGARSAVTLDVMREMAQGKTLPSTGKELIDAVFKHYQKICMVKNIDVDLIFRGIPNLIKQSEFETLVVNLLENATIACEHKSQAHKSVVVNISDGGISVMDNGIAFERETLELLGKQRITTHADSSGSGLGLLTIFEIARTYKASVVITETEEYKTVAVRFDGEDEYRVESEKTLRV
jgi:signal transduction histidine kinase